MVDPIGYPQEIILNVAEAEVEIGETLQLEATILPENTTDNTIVWIS